MEQSTGLNLVHILGLLAAGTAAGIVIYYRPEQEAVAALLLTATISAIILSWNYQSNRLDSDKKNHSQALNVQFFAWVRSLDLGPRWETDDYAGFPYCPVMRIRAAQAPDPAEPSRVADWVPVKSIPTFSQALEHVRAYPSVLAAYNECETVASTFNSARTTGLPKLVEKVSQLMRREYPNLPEVPNIADMTIDSYSRIRCEYLVYERLRQAIGEYGLATADPYPDGAPSPRILHWQAAPIIISGTARDLDSSRLVATLRPAWEDAELLAWIRELHNLRGEADRKLPDLVREFANLNERLATGHRLLGTCVNGL